MFKKTWVVWLVIVFCLAFGVSISLAGSATFTGTIDPGDPTLPVVFISTPNCTGQGSFPVHYEVYPITVDADGTYNFTLTDTQAIVSLYIFASTFDPANP